MELKDCIFGEHFQFPPKVEMDEDWVEVLMKAAVSSYDSVNKEVDEMILREIIKAAQDNGVTDLTVLNRKFILEALKEKWDRMDGKEDVAPVVHGEWILKHIGAGHYWECSVCHKNPSIYVTPDAKFCPNCGAKMDGG